MHYKTGGNMNKNIKRVSVVCLCLLLSGCSMFQSALNDIKGNLVGNGYMLITKLIANTVFKLNCTHN